MMNFKTHPDRQHRDAIRRAHDARGETVAHLFGWLFGRK